MNRSRLDAESVRDATLQVTGRLDEVAQREDVITAYLGRTAA